ncbi:unnamed protein product [Linum tenue]|uniref:Uncharacterized protein n=1 Tax=Linum tenue TaxID=586396 RepID=A0AAV0IYB4_9ROSI|nr:unnamed protein product [Linum tenue]CAI0423684.1 unnamed protein product [Linum tenue]
MMWLGTLGVLVHLPIFIDSLVLLHELAVRECVDI